MDGRSLCAPRWSFAMTAVILALGFVPVRIAPGLETLRDDQSSLADVERREQGYYEQLLNSGRHMYGRASGGDQEHGSGNAVVLLGPAGGSLITRTVDDLREFVGREYLSMLLVGRQWTTNEEGMRDRSYSNVKPAGI